MVIRPKGQAALALRDRMVAMGFDEEEADQNIEVDTSRQGQLDDGLFATRPRPKPAVEWTVQAEPEALGAVVAVSPEKIVLVDKDGVTKLRVTGFLTPEEKTDVAFALPEAEKARWGASRSPCARPIPTTRPCARRGCWGRPMRW